MRKKRKKFAKEIILSLLLICLTTFSAQAQNRAAQDGTIADYLKNLPEKYKTFSGDFSPPSKDSTLIDEENRYAAYLDSPPPGTSSSGSQFPIFEMALFKSQTNSPLLVVSNRITDSVCIEYETFFLRRVGNNWTEIKREVLPPMNLQMFWDAPRSAGRLLKIIEANRISYRFEPPRRGTQMKVSLEICDYLEDDAPEQAAKELSNLIESAKTIYLTWDKQKGKFNLAK